MAYDADHNVTPVLPFLGEVGCINSFGSWCNSIDPQPSNGIRLYRSLETAVDAADADADDFDGGRTSSFGVVFELLQLYVPPPRKLTSNVSPRMEFALNALLSSLFSCSLELDLDDSSSDAAIQMLLSLGE